jgi:hypothetical protein
VGNFPQAFSHISLVNSAVNLCRDQESWAEGMSHGHRLEGRKMPAHRRSRPRAPRYLLPSRRSAQVTAQKGSHR